MIENTLSESIDFLSSALDRNSWEPLYNQIAERIQALVEHELQPGAQIPSENELMIRYNVSRNTVRMAIDRLIKQGLVRRIKGRGTFVTPERMQFGLYRLVSFSEEIQKRGMHPSSRLISLIRTVPPPKISQALQLESAQTAFSIERLRLADNTPLALNYNTIPCHFCPTLEQEDLEQGSIYRIIEEKYHLRLGFARQILKPVIADEKEARLLEVEPGSPLLLVEGVASLLDGTPFEYSRLIYRGDRYEFLIEAVRNQTISNAWQEGQ